MERATGQTTRLVDYYIQVLFTNPNEWIPLKDHWESGSCEPANKHLLAQVQRRMYSEHLRGNKKLETKQQGVIPYIKYLPNG